MSVRRIANRMPRSGKANAGLWIQEAIKRPGALHHQLGIPMDQKIPMNVLRSAAKASGKLGQRARLALKLRGFHNPEDAVMAERLAEEFHGRPVREIFDIEEREIYSEYGGVLGELQRLDILMDNGRDFQSIEFDFEEGADDNILVMAPDKHNIEFVGGDQDFNWWEIDGATQSDKNLVLVGPVCEIDYFADKHHLGGPETQKDGITYFHEFGDEGGDLPWLVFDTRNRKLLFTGGDYTIEPEGITG
jgi:hypothetical protein